MIRPMAALLALCVLLVPLRSDMGGVRFWTDTIPAPVILLPDGEPAAEIFLLSAAAGWGRTEEEEAERLRSEGAIVVGIDLPRYLQALEADPDDCAYLVSDIESLSKQIQRHLGASSYLAPIIAGQGAGGALALAIAAQTPDATVERTVAVDPQAAIALKKVLCTPAPKEAVAGGMRYGLPDEGLTNPADIILTPGAAQDAPLIGLAPLPRLSIRQVAGQPDAALEEALAAQVAAGRNPAARLPLSVQTVKTPGKRLAIIISGDGGWRDIDQQIARFLQDDGIPSVGLDALRYFWRERTPEETASALQSIIDLYGRRMGSDEIMLIGYSFGANVLPATYLAMDAAHRAKVTLVSLLSMERKADFQVSVLGWAGKKAEGTAEDPTAAARRIQPGLVQCIYGEEDDESGCPALAGSGARLVRLEGGHHFDGDYRALTNAILATRTDEPPAG